MNVLKRNNWLNYNKLILLFIILFIGISVRAVNVTFRVDLGVSKPSAVYVGSGWAGWDPAKFQQLTDDNQDGIYELTIDLPAGEAYDYRYKIGERDWNNFEDMSKGGTCGAGPAKQDRHIIVPPIDIVLPVYCFGYCYDCSSVEKTFLNLSVDMSDQVVSADGVHVAGTFNAWNTESLRMTDDNKDGIYTISIPIASGSGVQEYKFLNGKTWGTEETVFGKCEFRSNRIATIENVTVDMPVVKFEHCNTTGAPISDIKIACIGNSITHGAGVSSMYTKSWPILLRDLLGVGYYTENLGVSGSTMLKISDNTWWDEPQYKFAFELNPDIIVIKLGTNDSKPINWNKANYKADYLSLIDQFRAMRNAPQIYITLPAKAYSAGWGISNSTILNELIPTLLEIAKEKMLPVIDMYNATSNMSTNFPDGIHPNDAGALVIAKKIKAGLMAEKPEIKAYTSISNYQANNNYNWYFNGELIENSNFKAIKVTKSGNYQVAVKAEKTNDILLSKPYTVALQANTSSYLASNYTTTGIITPNKNNVIIYPNPAKDILYIENAENKDLKITTMLGQIVYEQNNTTGKYTVNTSMFKPGVYLLSFSTNNSVTTSKILIK